MNKKALLALIVLCCFSMFNCLASDLKDSVRKPARSLWARIWGIQSPTEAAAARRSVYGGYDPQAPFRIDPKYKPKIK